MNDDLLGKYEVTIEEIHDPEHWECIRQSWTKNGIVHRIDGPAIQLFPIEDDTMTFTEILNEAPLIQEWYFNGKLHRDNGPARIVDDGTTRIEEWFENNNLHRMGAPAITETSLLSDVVEAEQWYHQGKLHRINGPAVVNRDDSSGEVISEQHHINGVRQSNNTINSAPNF